MLAASSTPRRGQASTQMHLNVSSPTGHSMLTHGCGVGALQGPPPHAELGITEKAPSLIAKQSRSGGCTLHTSFLLSNDLQPQPCLAVAPLHPPPPCCRDWG